MEQITWQDFESVEIRVGTITKVEDIVEIMKYNIMMTPALVVDEKVVIKGRVPSAAEIKQVLTK